MSALLWVNALKKGGVLLNCGARFSHFSCYCFYLRPLMEARLQHRQLLVRPRIVCNRGSTWPPQHFFHWQRRKTATAAALKDCVNHSSTLKLRHRCEISPLLLPLSWSQRFTLPVLPASLYLQFHIIIQTVLRVLTKIANKNPTSLSSPKSEFQNYQFDLWVDRRYGVAGVCVAWPSLSLGDQ